MKCLKTILGGLFLLLLMGIKAEAKVVKSTLYLNPGNFIGVDSLTFPAYAFNTFPSYNQTNAVVSLLANDTLKITIINLDTLPHGWEVKGLQATNMSIAPQDSQTQLIHCPNPGVFPYFDGEAFPKYQVMGAAGMIVVKESGSFKEFYWNVREYQKTWNEDLALGIPVVWNEYNPTYFTINGKGKPDLISDPTAIVKGNIGDTIRIYIMNSGRSIHSMHFHGYHVTIKFALASPEKKNWSKDTVPLKSLGTMVLEMVPDKPGLYPVHDHNLIATTGGGDYPNGIFLIMDIQ